MHFEDPWEGPSKIVIGIDVGTTQSGVAYAFLQNGAKQAIHRVTQWPGQESRNPHGKIPTILWYDSNNKAVSFGAEALTAQAEEEAEDNGWKIAKHFKLHLHPPHLTAQHGLELEDLPFTVPLSQIYADFLGYLLRHTQTYFEDHIIDGRRIWQQYKPTLEVVLAHPNGWGNREQAFLRLAAVKAGFTNANDAASRVYFVNETEASVHFCALYSDIGSWLKTGATFAVCDAGRSKVSTTVYAVKGLNPICLEQTRASDCWSCVRFISWLLISPIGVQAGALFVNISAERYLRKILNKAGVSQEHIEEYATRGIQDFELHSKRAFKDVATNYSIEIAGTRYNNASIRAQRGRIILQGSEVKALFDPCVDKILESVNSQLQGGSVSHILLVGEFSESPYLHEQLKKRFEPMGCDVTTTSERTSRAVADGAVLWHASQCVIRRSPRSSWGIETSIAFDRDDPSHQDRMLVPSTLGWMVVPGRWKCLVRKGTPIDVDAFVRVPFSMEFSNPSPKLDQFELDLYGYSGGDQPVWVRGEQGQLLQGFYKAAHLQVDLEGLRGALELRISAGTEYWRLGFGICIRFDGTELEAHLEWEENQCKRIGPCTIISVFEEG